MRIRVGASTAINVVLRPTSQPLKPLIDHDLPNPPLVLFLARYKYGALPTLSATGVCLPNHASCYLRDHAFKLKPLSLSTDLITQLRTCAHKLNEQATVLQALVQKGKNKDKHYKQVMEEALSWV